MSSVIPPTVEPLRTPIRFDVRQLALSLAVAMALTVAILAAPAAALADSLAISSNWSGYAVTGASKSARFDRVAGSWIQPRGSCTAGQETYSVAWVGLGGFNRGSRALEQTGTALDCTRSGHAVYSAWYELVPANPVTMSLAVHPHDLIDASVAEKQGRTILQVRDLSTHASRTVVRRASTLDLSSAEWIVEAPSICITSGRCTPLPLTDFGTVSFFDASEDTETLARAAIDAQALQVTRLELRDYSDGRSGPRATAAMAATGVASALSAAGNAFTVTWRALAGEGSQAQETRPTPPTPPPRGLTSAAASIRR